MLTLPNSTPIGPNTDGGSYNPGHRHTQSNPYPSLLHRHPSETPSSTLSLSPAPALAPVPAQLITQPGVERRRTKNWERLNAPSHSYSDDLQDTHPPPHPRPAQPYAYPYLPPSHPANTSFRMDSSPSYVPEYEPEQDYEVEPTMAPFSPESSSHPRRNHDMSSSPIRHVPPGSSPFKSQSTAVESETNDVLCVDEMHREWGKEYSASNSLLYSLVSGE
jgi:hypothetical protein